jgi:GNAT superfamily N-acetyltransferase
MNTEITIREAVIDDLPILLKFEQGIVTAERPFDPTLKPEKFHYYDLASRIVDPDAAVVVACNGNNVVGSGSAIVKEGNNYNTYSQYAFLGFMFVEPTHRGQGINSMIIDHLVAWSRARGLQEIRLHVYDENATAIRAYERVGFRKILTEMRLHT